MKEEKAGRQGLEAAFKIFDKYLVEILGVLPLTQREEVSEQKEAGDAGLASELMNILMKLRSSARKEKNFALSDTIRDELALLGIELVDTKEGSTWKLR